MRKGRLILGILLLIVGIFAFGFGGIAYSRYSSNSLLIASGLASNSAANQSLVNTQFGDAIGGFLIGVIFFVVGLVLMIIGFRGKSKKETAKTE